MTRRPRRTIILVCALTAGAALAGCNIVAPIFFLVHGPPKLAAVHKLEPGRPTVVFVDDRNNRMSRRSLRLAAAEAAQAEIARKGLVERIIDSRSAFQLAAARDRQGQPMSIEEIGQTVGADVVVYVIVDEFAVSGDGSSTDPVVRMRMKVIDARNAARLFPEDDPAGYRFGVGFPPGGGYAPTDRAEVINAENALAQRSGLAIAQLFYEHERKDSVTDRR